MQYSHLAGFLARDAETRFTSDGKKVTSLIMATNSRRGGQEEVIWWRITLWGTRWDNLLPHLTKGKAVMVGGQMRKPEIYTDKSGQPQVGSIELFADYLQFAPGNRQDQQMATHGTEQQQGSSPQPSSYTVGSGQEGSNSGFIEEESLPF